MVVMSASEFSQSMPGLSDITVAYRTLIPAFGMGSAVLFVISLAASGISSSVVGTMRVKSSCRVRRFSCAGVGAPPAHHGSGVRRGALLQYHDGHGVESGHPEFRAAATMIALVVLSSRKSVMVTSSWQAR